MTNTNADFAGDPRPTTPPERAAQGKAVRASVPRRSHAQWEPPSNRPDPVALLEEQASSRVRALVPIRYGRMLASPFAFFRGSALIMASDLASTPRSPFRVQLAGDAHVSNFGMFGTPERRLVFDINDFDETSTGPFEWDLKRLAASIVVLARERNFSKNEQHVAALSAVASYRSAMRRFAGMSSLDVWYAVFDVERTLAAARGDLDRNTLQLIETDVSRARTRDSLRALEKLTTIVDGEPRIISDPPLVVPIEELVHGGEQDEVVAFLRIAIRDYAETLRPDHRVLLDRYRLVHFARKVVGVGSVGTRTWIALLIGRDLTDPLFLQVKEAQESVLERFLGPSEYSDHGQRVVEGQRLMQAASDIFLGWKRVEGGANGTDIHQYVRQLQDLKGSVDLNRVTQRGMNVYSEMCAWTLARAHARSGDRIAIGAYLGNSFVFDDAIAAFAEAYADQNERDYRAFADAVKSGRIQATTGV